MALCECGCGQETPLARCTDRSKGIIKGQPLRFIRGHHSRLRPKETEDHIIQRFNSKYVVDDTGCWLGKGTIAPNGYGHFRVRGKGIYAHRFSYEIHKGKIPAGMTIDHLCRTPGCVNPFHLDLVTNAENIRRSGSTRSAIHASVLKRKTKTTCKRGHPLNEVNTFIRKDGSRSCRLCNNIRLAAKRKKAK